MKDYMKQILLTVGFVVVGAVTLSAQPNKGNPGVNPTPIDGGISLLLAAGAAFGGKKAFDTYKAKREE